MSYLGFYINLDRSVERRRRMEAQLDRHGIADLYTRFVAAEGNALGFPNPRLSAGEIGCFTSHYQLLKENVASPSHLHVMEDDAVISSVTRWTIDQIIRSGTLGKHDLIFTHSGVAPPDVVGLKRLYDSTNIVRGASGNILSFELRRIEYKTSTSSYIVNRSSIAKIVGLFEDVLRAGTIRPIDLSIRNLMRNGKLEATCMFPFVTSVAHADTLIEQRGVGDASRLAMDVLRRAFFVERDLEALMSEAKAVPFDDGDKLAELLGHCLRFAMTRDYDPF